MKIEELGEYGLIDRISRRVRNYNPRVVVGIGDDAAILKSEKGELLVVTTDTMIEDVHFDLRYSSYFAIGWKALASNISDCAAMGGTSKEVLITLGLPHGTSVEDIDELYDGIGSLAKKYGIDIIGGDTISSPDKLVLSVTLLGEVEKKNLLLRSGAKVGDYILVTGTLGDAAAGLKKLKLSPPLAGSRFAGKIKKSKLMKDRLIEKHLMPRPQAKEGRIIAKSGYATSMIDNSDGLARCIMEICRMSRTGAQININAIPISDETRSFSALMGIDPLALAFNGGEDYGLVFTARPRGASKIINEVFRKTHTPVTIIGTIKNKRYGINLVRADGHEMALKSGGYEHFRVNKW